MINIKSIPVRAIGLTLRVYRIYKEFLCFLNACGDSDFYETALILELDHDMGS